jgi:FAD:protein FMN transferase
MKLLLLINTLLLALLTGCTQEPAETRLDGKTMGTSWSLIIASPPPDLDSGQLQQQAERILEQINSLMSTYREDSEISSFNRLQSTQWFKISAETLGLLQAAAAIHRESGGAFDPTVSTLVDLWGFGPGLPLHGIPEAAQIKALLHYTGMEKLEIDAQGGRIRKRVAELQIDLSAIAKGYAVDQLAALLDSWGVSNYLVEIGGEIRTAGSNSEGRAWRIAVEQPLSVEQRLPAWILNVSGAAVATSGDYRNFFDYQGKRYSHIINPVSGWPVTHSPSSVTVIADDCLSADAWATAYTVIGRERGLELADALQMAVLFLSHDGDEIVRSSSRKMLDYLERSATETHITAARTK